MNDERKSLGLVLGRFQPLHPGHLFLIDLALKENDFVVICIGSAQKAEPLTIEERHERMRRQLDILHYPAEKYRIVDLVDPEPMEIWPRYVKETCGITDETHNRFYRGEELPQEYAIELERLGFELRIVKRSSFYVEGEDGIYHIVNSATEIRQLKSPSRERL